jgi:GntR family transcriptional regulator/MocR family aminotransferase
MQLRTAIAHHISFTRSVSSTPEDVLVCSGAQQAFDLIAKVFIEPGVSIAAVEDPGYPPLRRALRSAGARIVPVRVDAEGILVKDIPAEARLIFVTPSHQFPLGSVMSYARRQELLDRAYHTGAIVVEDDYDGEFRHSTRPVDALQTLDRRTTVLYVGTFSKSLFPGLRLGFIVSPAWAHNVLAAAKLASDWHTDVLHQAALAEFIREGHLIRHIRKCRRLYTQRYAAAVEALTTHFDASSVAVIPAAAGLHLTCRVPGPAQERLLAESAAGLGLRVTPLAELFLDERYLHGVALGLGRVSVQNIARALATLGRHHR